MVAVQSFRDVFTEVPLTPGIVYLCKRHYYDPILGPDAKREQAVSETEGEKGTELRPCDFTGHMALTAECARLRREAAAKDGAIDAIGVLIVDKDATIARLDEDVARWISRTVDAESTIERLTAEQVESGRLVADLQQGLAAANVQLDKIRQLCTEAEQFGGQDTLDLFVDDIRAAFEEASEAACRKRHPAGKDLPEVTHLIQAGGRVTPCCDKSPLVLPRSDRMTLDPSLVTCIQAAFERRSE
jgi:hypothetical protein